MNTEVFKQNLNSILAKDVFSKTDSEFVGAIWKEDMNEEMYDYIISNGKSMGIGENLRMLLVDGYVLVMRYLYGTGWADFSRMYAITKEKYDAWKAGKKV